MDRKIDYLENITLDAIEEIIRLYKETGDVKLFNILEKLIKTGLNISVEKNKINNKHYERKNNILIATTAEIIDKLIEPAINKEDG